MSKPPHFLIIDGYPKKSRDDLEAAGMTLAWKLYADMLEQNLAGATHEVLLPSDPGVEIPTEEKLRPFDGILWTGCNLSVNDTHVSSVAVQIELARRAFDVGIPSFGSCWGLQIAVVAAGGEVAFNPRGREMGMARKIFQTGEAHDHPMFRGKPRVFEAFISHEEEVTRMPPGGVVLAGNSFTAVQAAAISHERGVFWGVQYHPEYTLHEMARLIVAREEKLVAGGFFRGHDDLTTLVDQMEALAREPHRKDLRWQLAIDDDVLSDSVRQREFANWLEGQVLARTSGS